MEVDIDEARCSVLDVFVGLDGVPALSAAISAMISALILSISSRARMSSASSDFRERMLPAYDILELGVASERDGVGMSRGSSGFGPFCSSICASDDCVDLRSKPGFPSIAATSAARPVMEYRLEPLRKLGVRRADFMVASICALIAYIQM